MGDTDCLIRSMLENDAIFTLPDYTIKDRADFMLVFVFAAFETTASSITNLIYTMWKYPEETEKLRKAIMDHPELSNPETVFTFDALKNFNELECFINESMRMIFFQRCSLVMFKRKRGWSLEDTIYPKVL